MADKGYRGGLPKIDWTFKSIYRAILIILVPYTALSIGLLPPLLVFLFVIRELDFYNPLHIVLLAFVLIFLFMVLIFTETLVPGLMIKMFGLKFAGPDKRSDGPFKFTHKHTDLAKVEKVLK